MDIFEQLKRDEGVRKFPYTDTTGHLSIGTGRNLQDDGISDIEIDFLLRNDVNAVSFILNARLPWFRSIDPVRQGALMNMCFNLGFNGLEEFGKMLTAFAKGDWTTAAAEMVSSAWAKEVGDRAKRLETQILTGQWQ